MQLDKLDQYEERFTSIFVSLTGQSRTIDTAETEYESFYGDPSFVNGNIRAVIRDRDVIIYYDNQWMLPENEKYANPGMIELDGEPFCNIGDAVGTAAYFCDFYGPGDHMVEDLEIVQHTDEYNMSFTLGMYSYDIRGSGTYDTSRIPYGIEYDFDYRKV